MDKKDNKVVSQLGCKPFQEKKIQITILAWFTS